jgi:uncharacterized protein (UPF0218 family)
MKVPIHVSIDYRLLKDLDAWRRRSRSAVIEAGIRRVMNDELSLVTVGDMTTRQLMGALSARDDVDPTLAKLLIAMLTDME